MIAHLTFGQQQDDGPTCLIPDDVELGVQPVSGVPEAAGNILF